METIKIVLGFIGVVILFTLIWNFVNPKKRISPFR